MPIHVSWYNESKTAIHLAFIDPWSWDDFFLADKKGTEMLGDVSHQVSFLADFTQARQFPRGMSLQRVRSVLNFDNENSGMVVAFGVNPFLRVMINTMLTAAGRTTSTVVVVRDLEEALDLLEGRKVK